MVESSRKEACVYVNTTYFSVYASSLGLTILISFNQKTDEKQMINVKIRLTAKTKEDLFLDNVAEICKA